MYYVEYIISLTVISIITVVIYLKLAFKYWKRRNVPYVEPSIPFGNLENPLFMKNGFLGILKNTYHELKRRNEKFGGFFVFFKPMFLPTDLELIKHILTKDFQYFRNHGNVAPNENDPLTQNILNLEDDKWKNLRTKLTPTFTSGKMKLMFEVMIDSGDQMIEHINHLCSQKKPLDVKEIFGCYATDVIGSCAFGLQCNSFKDPDAEFRKYGRKAVILDNTQLFKMFIMFVVPEVNKYLNLKMFPDDITDFFMKTFKDVADYRNSTDSKRNDFVQLLLDINSVHGGNNESLSMKEMVAQAFLFFLGGFETTSTSLTFSLHTLAYHQDIQEKVRCEINEVLKKYDGKLSYDGLVEMKYMDQVVEEILRLFPPIPFLNRQCSADYKIPNTNVTMEKGTSVMISILGLHMDEEYYPNPTKFNPDRFTKENKLKRHTYAYLPFGEGPRSCIGMRFGMLQIKLGLALILKNFRIFPHESTSKEIKFKIMAMLLASVDTILLNAEPV